MSDDLAPRLAQLSARFAARAAEEAAALRQALAAGDRASIIERAHKLAGNAGMFGHPEIGAAALALEEDAEAGAMLDGPAERLLALLDEVAPAG